MADTNGAIQRIAQTPDPRVLAVMAAARDRHRSDEDLRALIVAYGNARAKEEATVSAARRDRSDVAAEMVALHDEGERMIYKELSRTALHARLAYAALRACVPNVPSWWELSDLLRDTWLRETAGIVDEVIAYGDERVAQARADATAGEPS